MRKLILIIWTICQPFCWPKKKLTGKYLGLLSVSHEGIIYKYVWQIFCGYSIKRFNFLPFSIFGKTNALTDPRLKLRVSSFVDGLRREFCIIVILIIGKCRYVFRLHTHFPTRSNIQISNKCNCVTMFIHKAIRCNQYQCVVQRST